MFTKIKQTLGYLHLFPAEKNVLFTGMFLDFLGRENYFTITKRRYLKSNVLIRSGLILYLLVMAVVSLILLLVLIYMLSKLGGRSIGDKIFMVVIVIVGGWIGLEYFVQAVRGILWSLVRLFATRVK